jgi:hypothetical protein
MIGTVDKETKATVFKVEIKAKDYNLSCFIKTANDDCDSEWYTALATAVKNDPNTPASKNSHSTEEYNTCKDGLKSGLTFMTWSETLAVACAGGSSSDGALSCIRGMKKGMIFTTWSDDLAAACAGGSSSESVSSCTSGLRKEFGASAAAEMASACAGDTSANSAINCIRELKSGRDSPLFGWSNRLSAACAKNSADTANFCIRGLKEAFGDISSTKDLMGACAGGNSASKAESCLRAAKKGNWTRQMAFNCSAFK